MTKLTNKYKFPLPVVEAVKRDDYSRGESDITVTELIDSPRIVQLRRKHQDDIVEDVSDRFYALLGKVAHGILEHARDIDSLRERRLYMDVDGWKLGGQLDRQCLIESCLSDYKLTSKWAVSGQDPKREWGLQLNVLAALLRANDYDVKRLEIIALLRDHTPRDAQDNRFPDVPIVRVPVPMWSASVAIKYIRERVHLHKRAREGALPFCTDEERWYTGDKWAVMKSQQKRAKRVLDSKEEAEQYIAEHPKEPLFLEFRPGQNNRCKDYCDVAPFCDQWKQLQEEKKQ